MLILIRLLPLLTLYILFFLVEFKIAMIGYVSACAIQLVLYKILMSQFSRPHFFYFISGLIFVGAALYFKYDAIFMYEISFLLMVSAFYILYKYLKAEKGELYLMGALQPTNKKLVSLTYLNYLISFTYFILALVNIIIIQFLSETYWINFRVFGVYLCIMLVSTIIGFRMAKSEAGA